MILRNRLKVLRAERNWSQTELANRFASPKRVSTISQWERGHRIPDVTTALELSRIFSVPVELIFALEVA